MNGEPKWHLNVKFHSWFWTKKKYFSSLKTSFWLNFFPRHCWFFLLSICSLFSPLKRKICWKFFSRQTWFKKINFPVLKLLFGWISSQETIDFFCFFLFSLFSPLKRKISWKIFSRQTWLKKNGFSNVQLFLDISSQFRLFEHF